MISVTLKLCHTGPDGVMSQGLKKKKKVVLMCTLPQTDKFQQGESLA